MVRIAPTLILLTGLAVPHGEVSDTPFPKSESSRHKKNCGVTRPTAGWAPCTLHSGPVRR
jgi:hypothetical protein